MRGFTLIELLVVISIIAILASMLLPAIGMVRESAYSMKCLSNTRQMVMGITQYQGEQEGFFPPGWVQGNSNQWDPWSPTTWMDQPFAGQFIDSAAVTSAGRIFNTASNSVFKCPKHRTPKYYNSWWHTSYCANTVIMPYIDDGNLDQWQSLTHGATVTRITATILITESSGPRWNRWDQNGFFSTSTSTWADENSSSLWEGRHRKGVNVGMADGSARFSPNLKLEFDAGLVKINP